MEIGKTGVDTRYGCRVFVNDVRVDEQNGATWLLVFSDDLRHPNVYQDRSVMVDGEYRVIGTRYSLPSECFTTNT